VCVPVRVEEGSEGPGGGGGTSEGPVGGGGDGPGDTRLSRVVCPASVPGFPPFNRPAG